MKEKKFAIYCRVLANDQTPENQRIKLTEYAQKNGYNYDTFLETESSRKTRPVKQELLQKLRKGEYLGVLIYKLDRWARSSTELILEVTELEKKGVKFISVSENLDFSTAAGKLHFQILCVFAEFERGLISERTKEGLRRAQKQGKTLGRPEGSKDKGKRKTSGYILREVSRRKEKDEKLGVFRSVKDYIK